MTMLLKRAVRCVQVFVAGVPDLFGIDDDKGFVLKFIAVQVSRVGVLTLMNIPEPEWCLYRHRPGCRHFC